MNLKALFALAVATAMVAIPATGSAQWQGHGKKVGHYKKPPHTVRWRKPKPHTPVRRRTYRPTWNHHPVRRPAPHLGPYNNHRTSWSSHRPGSVALERRRREAALRLAAARRRATEARRHHYTKTRQASWSPSHHRRG